MLIHTCSEDRAPLNLRKGTQDPRATSRRRWRMRGRVEAVETSAVGLPV